MEELSKALQLYADGLKNQNIAQFYRDLADAFVDEDFLELSRTIDSTNDVDRVHSLFEQQGKRLSEYNIRDYSAYFYDIHNLYVLYRLDRHKAGVGRVCQRMREVENQISSAEDNINNIRKISGILTGTEMLEAYAKDFDKEAKEHEKKARHWLGWLIFSIIGLAAFTASLLCIELSDFAILNQIIADEFKEKLEIPRIVALAIKGGLVAACAQIPLFLKKNYYAERHLEQTNVHRRNVLKSLHAVYNTVGDEKERDRLLVIGATVAFSEPESGFITRKEGAGSDGTNIDAILKAFTK